MKSYNYSVIDKTHVYTKGYLTVVFFRTKKLKKELSIWKWLWLTIVELIVGSELIESIVTTGSITPPENIRKEDSDRFGDQLHLTLHIPAGLTTNILRNHIIEVLYYKYYLQYLLLLPVGTPEIDHDKKIINCYRTRFRARKEVFSQLISLRRVYEFSWVIGNFMIDLIVYYISKSIEWALVSAIAIEALRRIFKI